MQWTGEFGYLGVGTLLGGITGGIAQSLKGASFRDGFTRGALGGAIAYSGRRIVGEDFPAAGLAGRAISAIGVSMVRNASDAQPSLARIMVPIGPVNVYVNRSAVPSVRVKLNLQTAWFSLVRLSDPAVQIDLAATVSSGAPVFRHSDRVLSISGDTVTAAHIGGTILLSDLAGHASLSHERVHVLQHDFHFLNWSDPVEGWLATKTRLGRQVYQYVDFGVTTPVALQSLYTVVGLDRIDQPFELEADFITNR